MGRRLLRFLRRHEHAEEVAVEAIGLDLLWAALRWAGLVGAGFALAAVTSTSSPRPHPRVPVPVKLALETPVQKQLVRAARRYGPGSGIVYVWGGSSPLGFDCSGYVNFVYHRAGITIPRDSRSQWSSLTGVDVPKGHEQPGDAVYFVGSTSGANAGPPPGHVGLYIGDGKFIQYYSSGKPAIVSRLDQTSDYMGAKRWWQPTTIDKRDARLVFWFARHYHARIAGSTGRKVTFKPWRGHGRFSKTRRAHMVAWAHAHDHKTGGNRHHLQIRF